MPTVLYRAESRRARVKDRRRLNALELKCLNDITGTMLRERINSDVV